MALTQKSALRHRPLAHTVEAERSVPPIRRRASRPPASSPQSHQQQGKAFEDEEAEEVQVDTPLLLGPSAQRTGTWRARTTEPALPDEMTHDEEEEAAQDAEDAQADVASQSTVRAYPPLRPRVPVSEQATRRRTVTRLPAARTVAPARPVFSLGGLPRLHPVIWLLAVLVVLLIAYQLVLFGLGVLAWGQDRYNDVRYGYPRTFSVSHVIGLDDSAAHPSHLVVTNMGGRIELVDFVGNQPTHLFTYVSTPLAVQGADRLPVTLSFVPGATAGMQDVVVHVGAGEVVLVNDGHTLTYQAPH